MINESSAREAIKTLYDLYAQDIYRYAWFNLGQDSAMAEEVVQEVYLRALRSWSNYRRESGAKTWLTSIARNYISDSFRKRKTERNFAQRYEGPSIHDEYELATDLLELKDALARMKASYRQVIVLRYIQTCSVKETGRILGWSEAKVRSTTHRAMEQLRVLFESNGEEVGKHGTETNGSGHPRIGK